MRAVVRCILRAGRIGASVARTSRRARKVLEAELAYGIFDIYYVLLSAPYALISGNA